MTPVTNILLLDLDSKNIDPILKHFGKLSCDIKTIHNGKDAWAFLCEGSTGRQKMPELILLALRIGEGDGLQILQQIRCNEAVQDIPVIIFTDSVLERHVLENFDLGKHSFVVEPVTYAKLFYALTFVGLGINRSVLFKKSEQALDGTL